MTRRTRRCWSVAPLSPRRSKSARRVGRATARASRTTGRARSARSAWTTSPARTCAASRRWISFPRRSLGCWDRVIDSSPSVSCRHPFARSWDCAGRPRTRSVSRASRRRWPPSNRRLPRAVRELPWNVIDLRHAPQDRPRSRRPLSGRGAVISPITDRGRRADHGAQFDEGIAFEKHESRSMSLGTGPDPNRFATKLFNGLPTRYDRLGYLLSMGQDRRWRSAVVDKVPAKPGELVLDVATGTAGVALALRAATGAEITGIDLNANMLENARQKLTRRGESGVRLVQGRAEDLPFADDTFDDVTFTYLLRYVKDPGGDGRRTRAGPQAGRRPRGHGLLRAAVKGLAPAVVVLHPLGPAAGRSAHRRTRVVRSRSLPRSQHRGPLQPSSAPARSSSTGRRRVWSTCRRGRCRSGAVSSCGRTKGSGD